MASDAVVPAVRIPLTASSWLGLPTNASAGNVAKYPQLGLQYQGLIRNLVPIPTTLPAESVAVAVAKDCVLKMMVYLAVFCYIRMLYEARDCMDKE